MHKFPHSLKDIKRLRFLHWEQKILIIEREIEIVVSKIIAFLARIKINDCFIYLRYSSYLGINWHFDKRTCATEQYCTNDQFSDTQEYPHAFVVGIKTCCAMMVENWNGRANESDEERDAIQSIVDISFF